MDAHSIYYRRRDSRASEHRDFLFVTDIKVSANDADRIAKMLLDDFGDVVETAWAERD